MKTIIFATNNAHKVEEVRAILEGQFQVLSLHDAGIDIDIPEPFFTLEENAREKARVINRLTGSDCFSEDTGLEVSSLDGEPGVKSARYAGEDRSMENNIEKLLSNLEEKQDRSAQFRTVLCLVVNNKEIIFEGICKGFIIADRRGASGFGYDPVFVPDGSGKTFAEMTMNEKNRYSHRKKAVDQLTHFLKNQRS
ncbi:MAG: RdgB/HAM1 family non-canonical purine NTP pyrophosphatase [Ginsengibacter sp.]